MSWAAVLVGVFLLSLLAGFFSRWFANRFGALDQPTGGRKIHAKPTPLFGGVGIGCVIVLFFLLTIRGLLALGGQESFILQLFGFLFGLGILLVMGMLDDRFNLPPAFQIVGPVLAALAVVFTGTSITHITHWSGQGAYSLIFWSLPTSFFGYAHTFSLPADVLTFGWILVVIYAMKFLDGLDGLVSGQAVIGACLIAGLALSSAYFQPIIAFLALVVAATYAGFLPHNLYPAKQFLGESGSTIAGFSLAFLAVVSGAKVATALMALGLPLTDASVVVIGRLLRGVSPFRGDDTHLHFKLLKAGLSQRQVVGILWAIALLFGLFAFGMQTPGKVFLVAVLAGVAILLPYLVRVMRHSRREKRQGV